MSKFSQVPRVPRPESIERETAIRRYLEEFAPSPHQDLLMEMMVTLSRLAKDRAGRGEVKVLNAALRELRYAFKVFAPYQDTPKVTIFGSARVGEQHPDYIQAKVFAEEIRRRGWMVITGAGDGIMRAGHDGATRDGSFGVAISLPFEQHTNDIIANDPKLVNFKYFFTRKLLFIKEAEAVALFPGGFGTQDEGFEALTLVQTGKANLMPIVMVDHPGGTYWKHWQQYVERELLATGMISPEDMHLFKITDRAEEAVEEICRFYRRYHSARMVYDDLVIRLHAPLPDNMVQGLARDFADVITSGSLNQINEALPAENGEYPHQPRLIFRFNRRLIGRLRQMIDRINAD
ncbi:MAG: hypothetical protein HJJLKODD_00983 [Phycisphaerae bacterium]|nr:hypothetical protein [Phycisphaerae bacterium]